MNDPSQVLLVTKRRELSQGVKHALADTGVRVLTSESFAAACEHAAIGEIYVVLLDLELSDGNSCDLVTPLLNRRPGLGIVVLGPVSLRARAMDAVRAGAADAVIEPLDPQHLLGAIDSARRSAAESPTQYAASREAMPAAELLGTSASIRAVRTSIGRAARSRAPVFITGESGTGKALCAQAIHDASERASGPFVALHCADLWDVGSQRDFRSAEVVPIVNFDAVRAAEADRGTLFLDSVCELNADRQGRFLRFLENSVVRLSPADPPRKIDVRIVCATQHDAKEEVRAGRFREDLYYRLNVLPIHMPPLRDREDDVVEIAAAALQRLSDEEGRGFRRLGPAVADRLRGLPWPGNVRQLLNTLRNVIVLNDGEAVTETMLPDDLFEPPPALRNGENGTRANLFDLLAGFSLAEIERLVIEESIARNGGSLPRAARELSVSPSTLYRKRDAWGRDDAVAD